MIDGSPRNIALFRETTSNAKAPLNHKSKYCFGCKRRRSAGQYQTPEQKFCNICTKRGFK